MAKVIVFTWTDAIGCADGWQDVEEPQLYEGNCLAAGIVVGETNIGYKLATCVTLDDGTMMGDVEIPKKMVHKILFEEDY